LSVLDDLAFVPLGRKTKAAQTALAYKGLAQRAEAR
jgi:hypothetical protein